MVNLKLEAPWNTYRKKLAALFDGDHDIIVGDIIEPDDECVDYQLDIDVGNHEKFIALDRVMPKTVRFGCVTLGICLYDEENSDKTTDALKLYETIFKGNPNVKEVILTQDHVGSSHGYVMFKPEVIQFFDDDIYDLHGNWTGLAQDIAREVFVDETRGIHFCTAPIE